MNTIERSRFRDRPGIEKPATQIVRQIAVKACKHCRFVERTFEHGGERRIRSLADRRRRDDQNIRGLVAVAPHVMARELHQPLHAHRRIVRRSRDRPLHVVGTEHDDHEIERCMAFEQARQELHAVALAIGEVIVKGRGAAIEPFRDHVHSRPERLLQNARPAILQRMTIQRFRIVTPGQTVTVAENGFHDAPPPC